MEEQSVNASEIPWKQTAAGQQRKILRCGPDGKPRVALIKLEPGFEMAEHSHDFAENHYVLEGMYESQGTEYAAGVYHFIPGHASHGPVRSPGGARILVSWER